MPDMSRYEADYPEVTPDWWQKRADRFPHRVQPQFRHFHQSLVKYCERMTTDNMNTVVDAIAALEQAMSVSKTTTIIPRLIAVNNGISHPMAKLALANFRELLKVRSVPKAYRI